ncbi:MULTISPECIES: ABC transporter substrate-binding protein [unclassified Paenibacillus]|uniref:ABC transporter substrate-binding protein n=1 Tax=unclassified Paenibacillus TaxID=185978 RepID=UPI0008AB62C3|nr:MULTISPECIES: ABC transporter substrate-binding protein [unclassified Paenibacillus]QLG40314.1 SgrR family transcriptional regulator [Paenibacillus sp. E222]SEN75369.1 DNA-binding transcriptional regulator SgrR of sgrS sRNA, contains a MarR-type HTH domain and a solute-binding domain [Paenibacillus sp. OK076]
MNLLQLSEHFFNLKKLFSTLEAQISHKTTLQELGTVWNCTPRNVKWIIRRLCTAGWIAWSPGRGRGNRSTLTILTSEAEVVLALAQEATIKGRFHDGIRLLENHHVDDVIRGRFVQWLEGQYGYRVDKNEHYQLDTLRLPFYRSMTNLDPAFTLRRTEWHMARQLFDTLLIKNDDNNEILPHLAYYWETDNTESTWTFYIRKGILFHDNTELHAKDVVYTLERLTSTKFGRTEWTELPIDKIRAIGPYCVKISLRRPYHLLPQLLASPRASILPLSSAKRSPGEFARLPIGSGPFRVVENDDSQIVLEAFPAYFSGRAQLDRVELWILPETRYRSLPLRELAGDTLPYIHPFQLHPRNNQPPDIERIETGCTYMTFQLNKPGPLESDDFRHWLSLVANPHRMNADLNNHTYSPAYSFFPDWSIISEQMLKHDYLNYGPSYLKSEPNFLEGPPVHPQQTLSILTYHILGDSLERNARWFSEQCAIYGVKINVEVRDYEEFIRPEIIDAADLVLANAVVDDNSVISFLRLMFDDRHVVRRHLSPEVYEHLNIRLHKIENEPEANKRILMTQETEQWLRDKRAVFFLYHLNQSTYYDKRLIGMQTNAYGWADFYRLALRPSFD